MSRARMVALVVTTTVLVLGGVAGSAAAATPGWLVKGTVLTGTQTQAVATTAAPVEPGEVEFGNLRLVCSGDLWGVSPQLESVNKSSASSLDYSGCTITGEGCSLSNSTIGSLPAVGEFTLDGTSGSQATFKAKTGSVLATIKMEGATCAETGKLSVTGTVHTSIAENPGETTLQLVEMNVTAASNELKVGSDAIGGHGAALLKLSNSVPWGFM